MAVRRFAAGLLCAFLLLPAGCGQAQETKDQQPKGEQELGARTRFPTAISIWCWRKKPASLWKLNTWRERSATVCSF